MTPPTDPTAGVPSREQVEAVADELLRDMSVVSSRPYHTMKKAEAMFRQLAAHLPEPAEQGGEAVERYGPKWATYAAPGDQQEDAWLLRFQRPRLR